MVLHNCTNKIDQVKMKLIVVDPGHFHAALLQKNKLEQVDDTIYVYAPSGQELNQYIETINSFNNREINPTSWQLITEEGDDFLQKAIQNKKGNVVILAGNNKNKTNYITQAINAGLNVLSDKPMAINKNNFNQLIEAFETAKNNNILLYDLMTERYDILNIIEKRLINNHELFGCLQQGTIEEPAITMESTHHFYKEVAGKPLIRPAWYYDVEQQGEGIADVTTHLIDLVNWKCFPEQIINYINDVKVIDAKHWATKLSLADFNRSTGLGDFPDYLNKYIKNSILYINANGTINYQINDINISLKVIWNYKAPKDGGDTFSSEIKGTNASLITIQDQKQNFKKQLYIKKNDKFADDEFKINLDRAINDLQKEFPFVSLKNVEDKIMIVIPDENRLEHEVHFGYVAKQFFDYLVEEDIPEWENTNTLAKYFITTTAVEIANR